MNAPSKPRVVVIGAGAAGISAAAWLRKLGVGCLWISKGEVGGTLLRVFNVIEDWPGFAGGVGRDAITALLATTPLRPQEATVCRLRPGRSGWQLTLQNGASSTFEHVILATGTQPRASGIEYEADVRDRILYSTSRHARQFSGTRVAVVGGGDGAIEGALKLANAGAEVDVYARSSLSARDEFVCRAISHPRVQIQAIPTLVKRIDATEGGCLVSCKKSVVHYAAVFLKIGVMPTIPEIQGSQLRLQDGYVWVDSQQQTSLAGIWAVGDVTNVRPQSLTTACGSGVRAAEAVATILQGSH